MAGKIGRLHQTLHQLEGMPRAQHTKAASFVRQNFFVGVSSFPELEARVASLPDEAMRGDAFEVFAEAYFSTQRKHDVSDVWPLNAVPIKTLQSLGLATKDYGVDGVFRTTLGNLNAYQVKFRTNRHSLTWRELSTFMGLADSPEIQCRVLFTNCDDLPSVLNERQGFFCIRGSDLDRLEENDFRAIQAWLADSKNIASKKEPRPHQLEALNALLPALNKHDRVSAIMACGTGKTLVALWVAERRNASRVLVLIPSLALLRQVLHEWLRETRLPKLAYLCVCSDPTVKDGLDSITTSQSDLDFQVSTERKSVREFLDAAFSGVKVIFCTYQSSRVVASALKTGESFDLAIFDEAHKTAGREGRNFAFALEDKNLPIQKRLFFTATPRHYNPHQKNQEGEAQLVFSMDRSDFYGPQAYCLTFAEAARRGIICGYKVIISVITSEMVTNELLKRGDVLVNGDAVRARQVANQIALRDAIKKYRARKVFTFHKTVKSAESFVVDGNEGIRTHLPEFQAFHVNGTMVTARRERQMRDFRAADNAVMSNARCLTEGVDVPAVDMVAFLSPRRSRVDIVQATGRAMRRSLGKTTGYVLVPLFVEQAADESVEAAVSRSDFDEVWDVLHSLQEQDDVLAELIRSLGEQKGRGKGFEDSRFADRVDISGFHIGLEELRTAVATRCFEKLVSSWDTYFGRLSAFKEQFGHCNPSTYGDDVSLGAWVVAQRTRRKKGALTEEQIRRLDGLGFVWDWQDRKAQETWMKWFRALEKYAKEHGNPHVPRTYSDTKLASWVWIQRQRRKGTYKINETVDLMTTEQANLLEGLGFRWDVRGEKWAENFERLKQFKARYGHCEVGLVDDEDALLNWVRATRKLWACGKLDKKKEEQLDTLGFSWTAEIRDHRWDLMYRRLVEYHATHGNTDVPHKWSEDKMLAAWVSAQRQRRKKSIIPDEQVRLLEKLGFTWQHRERGTWDEMAVELAAYKAKEGNCNVPMTYRENPKLGRFVNNMRSKRNRGELSAERIAKLDALGFAWSSTRYTNIDGEGISADWQIRFKELLRYKEAHGNCDVPKLWDENPQLGNWASQQRQNRKNKTLHPERERRLNEIGFDWGSDRRKQEWSTRYEQLKLYKERHGNTRVPVKCKENPALGLWVAKQRHLNKKGKLSTEQKKMLIEIGFHFGSE